MGRMRTILQSACLLTFVEYVLSELTVLRSPGAFYSPLVPFRRINSPPDIQEDYANFQPRVKYGLMPQLLPSKYPILAANDIMQTTNYEQQRRNIPILMNKHPMPIDNYPAPISRLSMMGNNKFRIPTYGIQIQKFPLPSFPNVPISQLNFPTYIPYPILVQQKPMSSNEASTTEQDPLHTGSLEQNDVNHQETNAEEDFMENSEDTVVLNSPLNATATADEKKDVAIDQTKGIVGDIISFIPFLPIEINVPDVISGIGSGIGWIFNGIGGWLPFFNRPSSAPSSRFSFALGPDGAPVIVPMNNEQFETAIDNDMFLY